MGWCCLQADTESGSDPSPRPEPLDPQAGAADAAALWAAALCSGSAPGAPSLLSSLQDAWSDQKGRIHLDAQQDYQLLQAQRTPQGLSLLFKRPFSTCDPQDYLIEVGGSRAQDRLG